MGGQIDDTLHKEVVAFRTLPRSTFSLKEGVENSSDVSSWEVGRVDLGLAGSPDQRSPPRNVLQKKEYVLQ